MAKNKIISDEEIIASLLFNGTIKKAAASVGISERSLYDRMNESKFIALYNSAKADLIRKAVFDLNEQVKDAIKTVAAIMSDEKNNPAIRLQAAQTILNNACKFAQRLQSEEATVKANEDNLEFRFFNID